MLCDRIGASIHQASQVCSPVTLFLTHSSYPRRRFHLRFLPKAHRSADFMKWIPPPPYPNVSVCSQIACSHVCPFLNSLLRIAFLGFSSLRTSSKSTTRRYSRPISQILGWIYLQVLRCQSSAGIGPRSRCSAAVRFESRFPQPERQPVHSAKVRVYAGKFTPYSGCRRRLGIEVVHAPAA
jgi:hypothetical protein